MDTRWAPFSSPWPYGNRHTQLELSVVQGGSCPPLPHPPPNQEPPHPAEGAHRDTAQEASHGVREPRAAQGPAAWTWRLEGFGWSSGVGRAGRGTRYVYLVRALGLHTPGRGGPARGSVGIVLVVNLKEHANWKILCKLLSIFTLLAVGRDIS